MPKSYLEVQDEFDQWQKQNPGVQTTLGEFAKQVDEHQGTVGERGEAYNDAWYKKANAFVDRGFRATGLPHVTGAAAGAVGSGFDSLLGTHIEPTVRRLGEDLPRMTAEALLTLPAAAVSGPVGPAAMWANRARQIGKVLGYGGSALGGYAQTESPIGAAISAGSMGLSNKLLLPINRSGVDVGGKVAGMLRDKLGIAGEVLPAEAGRDLTKVFPEITHSPDYAKNLLATVGGIGTEAVTQTGVNELTRQAQMSVGPRAVGPLDAERNPLTAENIAGNVAGALPFAGHMAISAIHPTGFDARQIKAGVEFAKERRLAIEEGMTREEFAKKIDSPFNEKDTGTLIASIKAHLSAASDADREGLHEDALRRRKEATGQLARLGMEEKDVSTAVQETREIDAAARSGLAMTSPEALTEFVGKVNGLIDYFNHNAAEAAEGKIETDTLVLDPKSPKQSSHPNAVSTLVTKRLQEKGLLEKITYDWLVKKRLATEEELGSLNHDFLNNVTAQKAANLLLDNLPTALKKESLLPPSATVGKNVNDPYIELIKTLQDERIPVEYRDRLIDKTAEYQVQEVEFRKKGGTPTGIIGDIIPNWLDTMQRVVETYDPINRTIDIGRGKVESIGVLWGDPAAGPKYTPASVPMKPELGGTPRFWDKSKGKKVIAEKKLEDLGLDVGNIAAAQVAFTTKWQEKGARIAEATKTLQPEQAWNVLKPFLKTTFVRDNAKLFIEALPDLGKKGKTGEGLSPAGVALLEEFKKTKTLPGTPLKQFQDMMFSLLQSDTPLEGVSKMARDEKGTNRVLNRGETAMGRAALIVDRLSESKAVEVAKAPTVKSSRKVPKWMEGGPTPLAMAQQEGGSLVTFAAPVRLRRWAAAPSGSFTPDSLGQVPSQGVKNLLTKLGITKDEMAIYESAGIDKLLTQKKVPVEALAKWMEEKTPRVEVEKLRPGQFDEIGRQAASAQHELETGGYEFIPSTDEAFTSSEAKLIGSNGAEVRLDTLPPNLRAAADFFFQHEDRWGANDMENSTAASDAATGRYGVEPKELKDMPGAVDILVRVPTLKNGENAAYSNKERNILFRGPHFGNSDVNVLASVRAFEIMAKQAREWMSGKPEYTKVLSTIAHLPDDAKILFGFEFQGDWAQKVAKARAEHGEPLVSEGAYLEDHPLLSVYEQLGLKAFIQHARNIGAEFAAIIDAESAMMTEGHDRAAKRVSDFIHKQTGREVKDVQVGSDKWDDFMANMSGWRETDRRSNVSQEPGMRAAYDPEKMYLVRSKTLKDEKGKAKTIFESKSKEEAVAFAKANPDAKEPFLRVGSLHEAMEKLTGEVGEPVEFGIHKEAKATHQFDEVHRTIGAITSYEGSPVFKDASGNPKTSVTARLYPIAKAPSEFSAFGYSKPMAVAEGAVGAMTDDLKNHPAPGAFRDDVLRTISAAVDKHFGGKGYSGDMRSMMHAATMAIVNSMKDVPVDFYKIRGEKVAGLANFGENRGKLGLGVEPISMEDSTHFVHRVLTALTHELAHIDDFVHFGGIDSPDAFSEERARQLKNLRSMFDATDEGQRRGILTTLQEALVPPGFRTAATENPEQLRRAATNVDEFSATVMTLVTNSLLFGEKKGFKNALETLDYSPTEVQEYAHYQFRAIRDVLQGMQDTLADPKIRAEAAKASIASGDPYVLSKAFSAVVESAMQASRVRDGTKEVAAAREMVKALSQGAGGTLPLVETEAVWQRRHNDIQEQFHDLANRNPYAMANAHEAMEMASTALGISYGKGQKPGWWARWFYPFAQLMHSMERSGVELAKPLSNLILDTESAIHRRYSDIVSPFIKQKDDGTLAWDNDHPLIKNQTPAVRGGINRVSEWQAENGMVPMFVDVQGQLVADTAARPVWDKIKASLSQADQQTVMVASTAMDKVGVNMARHTLSVLDESMSVRTARLLMMLDKSLSYDQAFVQGDAIARAYQTGTITNLTGFNPKVLQAADGLLGGPGGLVASFQQVKALLDSRPGFRTEQLPHEWVVMYKNAAGEVKFTSAPSERQAYTMKDRVVAAGGQQIGEIANRKDLRGAYQAFDDPDVLLAKFSQVEGVQWKKAVEVVRQNWGDTIAKEMEDSYTPGEKSLGDIGTQGFAKFLKGSESQVERGSFDYLDAMLARAARLSASASYKTHGAMKDLILNDPKARVFPTLQNLVNDHWENMLSPTSDMTKKVKALASGYFLGVNFSSAAVEGSQSIMSVIPTLIAGNDSGGPVRAYGQLFKSIANATEVSTTKEWQKVAVSAEAKLAVNPNAKLNVDETRALFYRRAVADGVIGHGVVQDLLYSRDQKTLQVAKFGQGDYGPVPLSDLATNKLYLGAQMLSSIYAVTSKFNDKIAFFAGLNQGIEKGMVGDDLYNHARQFKTLSTFGGGKANTPGWVDKWSNVHTRSAIGMVNTLQQYGYGMVAMYAQFAKDSIDINRSLDPQQRRQARKAFGTMLATQVAVGGALGVPFAGAALTVVEKLFGIPANQAVREGLASLGSDEDQGGVIAETALNGLGNQMFGVDVSSRVGVSNLLGTSAYRGFAVQDLLGPVPGMISNAVKGLNWFGQGETMKAVHELVPNAFKNAVAMADSQKKYGDYAIRDSSENLVYNPTSSQNIARLFGFRSREESQKRQAGSMAHSADIRTQSTLDRTQDQLARRLLSGDPAATRVYAQDLKSQDLTTNVDDVLRAVMERAVRMTSEKDLLAGGTKAGADERARIVGTFSPDVNSRQSEMQLTQLRMQLAAQLGAPALMPSGKAWTRAAVVDNMVQKTGRPRPEILALVQMMGM